ncbi:MAG: hypothetical protein LBI54_03350, partial [Lachnospiraceae bacterium]|jgi:hypothetical protein|nr:hypothetical protein [Lachnospiraceae bacterium]
MATSQNMTEKEADELLKSKMMLDRRMNKDEYREFMRDFCASVSRVVDFFGSRHPEINLEGGRVFGSGIGIANIDSILGEALGLEMEIVEHLVGVNIRNMKAIPGVNQLLFVTLTDAELAHYLPNIGALMNSLDLRLAEEAAGSAAIAKKGGISVGMVGGLLVFSIVIAVGTSGYFMLQKSSLEREKADTERSIESLRPVEAVYANYLAAGEYYNTFNAYVEGTTRPDEAVLQLIITLEEILPQGISLTSLSCSGGAVGFAVTGTKQSLARFLIELKKVPYIYDVLIGAVNDGYDDFGIATSEGPISFRIDYDKARAHAEATGSLAWQPDADFIGIVLPEGEEDGEEVMSE